MQSILFSLHNVGNTIILLIYLYKQLYICGSWISVFLFF